MAGNLYQHLRRAARRSTKIRACGSSEGFLETAIATSGGLQLAALLSIAYTMSVRSLARGPLATGVAGDP
eukprot:11649156-Alexandrium_andersonii.AAC.1